MLDTVKRTISDYMMLETSENVLVALSGGADSTALLLSLRELGYPVRVTAVDRTQQPKNSIPMEGLIQFGRQHGDIIKIQEK